MHILPLKFGCKYVFAMGVCILRHHHPLFFMRPIVLFFSVWLGGLPAWANMANPILSGSSVAEPFLARHVSILGERIVIHPDDAFMSADIRAVYRVLVGMEGADIPFIFLAPGYSDSAQVWINGQAIELLPLPIEIKELFQSDSLVGYEGIFGYDASLGRYESQANMDHAYFGNRDMFYFRANLPPGEATLEVRYLATAWQDGSGYVNKYQFKYELLPARYWKSFGSLEVVLEGTHRWKNLSTTLGEYKERGQDWYWNFKELPQVNIEIEMVPVIPPVAQWIIQADPTTLAYILGMLLSVLELALLVRYRRRHPDARINPWLAYALVWMLPIMAIDYFIAEVVLDSLLGGAMGSAHGYGMVLLVAYMYMLLMPAYLVLSWVIDLVAKKYYLRRE
jgi:hypothetical protein